MTQISTLIVDDHLLFAEALQLRLRRERDLHPVRIATSASEALALARAEAPDLVIMDYRLGPDNGIDLAAQIRAVAADCQVIILSGGVQVADVLRAMRGGARGWLAKTSDVDELLRAIRAVIRGDAWLSPPLLGSVLLELVDDDRKPTDTPLSGLTTRELEVLGCMVDGLTRTQIAARLYISGNTARTHTQNVLAKLDAHSTLEAVSIAQRHGMRALRVADPEAPRAGVRKLDSHIVRSTPATKTR
jgi:DNA-binding NarL/FixJ family response regulator